MKPNPRKRLIRPAVKYTVACMNYGLKTRIALLVAAGLILASCTMLGLGPGLGPGPGVTGCSAEAKALAVEDPDGETAAFCRALEGGNNGPYALARFFEAGVDDSDDPARIMKEAVRWYKKAARPSSGSTPVYMPPMGNLKYGRVINIPTGPATPGDARAQFRLAELYIEGRFVKQSDKKARVWLKRAADKGYPPAVALLSAMEAELASEKANREVKEIGG